MSLLPDRLKTVKVVVPTDHTRNLLRFLSRCEDVDIIDIQKKPFDISTFEHGPKIKELSDDFDEVIKDFEIEDKIGGKVKKLKISDESLGAVLKEAEKLSKTVISNLKKLDERITLAEQELEKSKSVVQIAKNLIPFGFSFEDLDAERPYFSVMVGKIATKRVPRFKWNLDAITDSNYVLKESKIEDKYSFIALGFLERYQEDINRLLAAYDFEKMAIPERISGDPEKVVQKNAKKIEELKTKIDEYKEEANQIIKENGQAILAYDEQLRIEKSYMSISNKMRHTKRNSSFWAWIPNKRTKRFRKGVSKMTDDKATIEISKPVFEESEFPTKTSVPKFMRVYDQLVGAYGTPGYNEFNTAILIQIFFPIIFGIMFADVGHGLLFALVGVYGLTLQGKRFDTSNFGGEIKNYLKNGAMMMIVSGIVAMFFGVMFGSYFGVTEHALTDPATHHLIEGWEWFPHPVWFSPEHGTHNGASAVILMLELSLVIGMVHMTVGHVLKFIKDIKKKHVDEAVMVTLMWAIFQWSLFILVFTFGTNFMNWFQWNFSEGPQPFNLALFSIGGQPINFFTIRHPLLFFLIGMAAPVVIMTGFLIVKHKLDGVAELLEILLSTLSHTVSYARIFAMNAVHGALSQIFTLQIFTGEGTFGALNFVGVAIGALVILLLEGLFSFIQTLRLNWVEFFSKFHYQGQGTKFQPLNIYRKYTIQT